MDRNFVRYKENGFWGEIEVVDKAGPKPEVSVIIPTLDGSRDGYFQNLLRQLRKQSYQSFETIIVNGDRRQGRAINVGAEKSRGEILIILDDDTQLGHDDVFKNLLDVLHSHSDIGMAGVSNLVPPKAPLLVRQTMKEIPRRHSGLVKKITESDLAEHPCCAIPKRVFFEVGGENEMIPRGLDPYLRSAIRKAGYRVVVIPNTWVHHLPPNNPLTLLKQFFRNGKMAAYVNKFFPQWVIDLPEVHTDDFVEKISVLRRTFRYGMKLVKALMHLRFIYFISLWCYMFGFIWGYFTLEKGDV
ncbi:glycosyltransferase [candidate division KSB1 bacterium]|nr:glycosyltransferase [candidate division KSB1 bacterium]